MKTRYRIMYNGEIYRVQEMAVRKFSLRFKRYWKNTTVEIECMDGCYTDKLESHNKQEALDAIEQLMHNNISKHHSRLRLKWFKKENPSGWRKVWP